MKRESGKIESNIDNKDELNDKKQNTGSDQISNGGGGGGGGGYIDSDLFNRKFKMTNDVGDQSYNVEDSDEEQDEFYCLNNYISLLKFDESEGE